MDSGEGYVCSSWEMPLKKMIDFADSTGYPVLQVNGQRLCGPPSVWPGSIPGKGCEVFVGKLPRDMFEYELVPLFQTVGIIYQMRLMMDFSGTNRGYAFVKYSRPSEAKRAVKELNGLMIKPGYRIYVTMSIDNCRLFVGGIPKHITEQQLKRSLSETFDRIVKIELYLDVVDKTLNRGFAFVEFENHRAAAIARRKAYPNKVKLWGCQLHINWASPEREVDEDILAKVKILYIRNISQNITENDIGRTIGRFFPHSEVLKVKKMKDFAFVHFSTREAAEFALQYFNVVIGPSFVLRVCIGRRLGDSVIEVMWAKPKERLLPEVPINHADMNNKGSDFSTSNECTFSFRKRNNYRKVSVREPSYDSPGTQIANVNDAQQLLLFGRFKERFVDEDIRDTVNPDAPVDVSSLITQFSNLSVHYTMPYHN